VTVDDDKTCLNVAHKSLVSYFQSKSMILYRKGIGGRYWIEVLSEMPTITLWM